MFELERLIRADLYVRNIRGCKNINDDVNFSVNKSVI